MEKLDETTTSRLRMVIDFCIDDIPSFVRPFFQNSSSAIGKEKGAAE